MKRGFTRTNLSRKNLNGFTLAEIMLVVAIIAILAVFTLLSFQRQTLRGFDSKRKTDLATFKAIFEDYYNDHTCYPTKELWDAYDCTTKANGDFLKPYLGGKDLPCDPVTNERYLYIALPETGEPNVCSGYKLFAALGDTSDLDIINSGCDPSPLRGCGYVPYKYNYGISAGGVIANPLFDFEAPLPTPTPTTGVAPGAWVCTPYALICQSKSTACQNQLIALGCTTFANGPYCTGRCMLRLDVCNFTSICE